VRSHAQGCSHIYWRQRTYSDDPEAEKRMAGTVRHYAMITASCATAHEGERA